MLKPIEQLDISGGISYYPKRATKPFQVAWLRSIDYRTDPNVWQLLPKTEKESGSEIQGLVKWIDQVTSRTDIVQSTTNLVTNASFETNTTGWSLDADYTRSSDAAFDGSYAIKQSSTSNYANFYSDGGITVEAYTDYQISFYRNITVNSGLAPLFQINTGSAFGATIDGTYITLAATSGWEQTRLTFNTGNNTTIWLRIFNNNGNVTAYYDLFTLTKVSQSVAYEYDDLGNIYKRTSNGNHSLLKSITQSHGNGLLYYPEDDFVYYMRDRTIGRYGPFSYGVPNFVDDFLGSEGGVPTNTHSLSLTAASSQYASRADTASLSITSDIAIEASIKPSTLPASGERDILVSKWDESGTLRSYSLELYGISGFFGDGSDGNLTISSNTTDAPTDSACNGTVDTYTLYATNASFAAGQVILIHQTQGTGAGTRQLTKIQSYATGVITTTDKLKFSYNSTGSNKAQVLVVKQYDTVTIQSGFTLTAKAWSGTVGGILAYLAKTEITGAGTITARGKGFRGGSGVTSSVSYGQYGENETGAAANASSTAAVGAGGGAGFKDNPNNANGGAGGGGGHAAVGTTGTRAGDLSTTNCGVGANTLSDAADLSTALFGGGGGSGGGASHSSLSASSSGAGGAGGGYIFLASPLWSSTLTIDCRGSDGNSGTVVSGVGATGSGGAGAGGSMDLLGQTVNVSSMTLRAGGGSGVDNNGGTSGAGGTGRIHIGYFLSTSLNTSTAPSPTPVTNQDSTLVSTDSVQLRLGVSSTGNNSEFLAKTLDIQSSKWQDVAASWDASASTATFYLDGENKGTVVGTLTAIHNNASDFHIGAMENSGGSKANFYDGLIDEVRVWNTERAEAQIKQNRNREVATNAAGLAAYYQLDNAYTDATANANDLSGTGSPTFSTDVPFSAPTSRLDLDQSLDTSGNTYTTPTAIAESATNRQSFVPAKDPQKSIEVLIAAIGTGNWTVTVHDALNREIATKTVANAALNTGDFEFVFDEPWRPVIGQTYHFHITSTVNDGTVTTTTASDLETVDFHTYYQFLVTDTVSHMATQMLNFIAICNERYLAKLQAGPIYSPMQLTFPAGYRSRCLGKWNEYLAIGVYRGNTIYDFDQGYVFFWNGTSTTYNFYIPVPEGGVNALYGSGGTLYIVAGYQGDVLEYTGGDRAKKIFRLPKSTVDSYVEMLPGAINMYKSLLRMGFGVSDSTVIERGVYTYGHLNEGDIDSLSYDYPISTGNRTSGVEIGCVYPIEKKLLVSWRDGEACGVDVIDPAGSCYQSGTIEFLVSDNGTVEGEKQLQIVKSDFVDLISGQTITMKYKTDRATNWTEGSEVTSSATDPSTARTNVPSTSSRNKEYQVAIDIETTTTSPQILSVTAGVDPLTSERKV